MSCRYLTFLVLFTWLVAGCGESPQDADAAPAEQGNTPPNVLILIADDMGYSDIGAFGSEIQTPNIDRLAADGVSFTNFHAGATCSPTRTMLISGVDNHRAGLGNMHEIMADNQFNQPGYEGHLNNDVVSIATVLADNGYDTYMAGKWHLGGTHESIPHARGFKRSFALIESGADNWVEQPYAPMYDRVHYYEDDALVSLPTENYFSSNFYTDKVIEFIESDREGGRPFLVWLGYQAVHYPHQAPKSFIDKYDGVYDEGWEATRQQRFARQKKLGLVDKSAELDQSRDKATVEDWLVPDWDALSAEEKKFNARRMQTYAGMLDNMDGNIGRLLNYLEDIEELDNTLIVFLADNGPDPNQLPLNPEYRAWYQENYTYTYMGDYVGDYSAMGQSGSFADYGPGWANAAATPTSYFKTFSTEGGLRVPLIVRLPGTFPGGRRVNSFMYVKDVFPTVLETLGITPPGDEYNGRRVFSPSGTSAFDLLAGTSEQVHAPGSSVGYELAGSSAIFRDNYKLSMNPPPKGTGDWELYDISVDPGEVNDLADEHPQLVAELIAEYALYERENGVIPVPEGYNPVTQLIKNSTGDGAL